jgi:hypothetical protein
MDADRPDKWAWGAKTRSCRWRQFVFMDETAEEVAAVRAD